MKRSRALSLLYVAPFLVAMIWLFLPVITGEQTLFLRDVLNTHLEMKWFQAEAMRDGTLPLVDPYRSGGQPHLGNPNTVPLYPDNLLYLVMPPVWVLNAHFWLHLLLAPLAVFYLGRRVGLGRAGAWTAGVVYASGGYYLSTLNLYNLTASTTLAPAFLGACIGLGRPPDGNAGRSRWTPVAAGLLWALLVLGGDPMTAVAALLAGCGLGLWTSGARGRSMRAILIAVVLGTLVAAPQVVEFLRIAPGSYRGVQGYSTEAATVASWSPVNLWEWLVPMAFGKPDLFYWGSRFHAGRLPLFYSFYPGLLALVLALVGSAAWRSGRKGSGPRPKLAGGEWSTDWLKIGWVLIAVGFFFVMGSYNPLASWLLSLPGMQIFRLPVKLWFLVAVGMALLAGGGMQRFVDGSADRLLRRWLIATLALVAALAGWFHLAADTATSLVGGWMPPRSIDGHAALEVARWVEALSISAGLVAVALGVVLVAGTARAREWSRGTVVAGGLLLAVHVLGQVVLLAGLAPTDSIRGYQYRESVLRHIPVEGRVVHGDAGALFGRVGVDPAGYRDGDLRWLLRETFEQLYPPAGIMAGRRYEFWSSPEGLDSFLTRAASQAISLLDDPRRVALLEASGVTHLLLTRRLADVSSERAELTGQLARDNYHLSVYHLPRAAPEVGFVGRVLRAADARQALLLLTDPTFDPGGAAVLAEEGPPVLGGRGSVEVVESGPESLTIKVRAEAPGAVLVQRSYLPIWKAELDGEPVDISVANIHRMAVEVGAGEHLLTLSVDRRTLAPSFALSLLGVALLGLRSRSGSPA